VDSGTSNLPLSRDWPPALPCFPAGGLSMCSRRLGGIHARIRRFVSDPAVPSLDHGTIKALCILAGCDRASENTLATQGVGHACPDALVARDVLRTYGSRLDNPKDLTMTWFAPLERIPDAWRPFSGVHRRLRSE